MTGIQDSAPPWRRLGLLALLALITNMVPVRAGIVTDHKDLTKPETESSTPASRSLFIDQRLLVPQDEFFLDMFIDRTPADGGYRVQRFYGYELFDPAREREVQRRRKAFESTLTKEFRDLHQTATPLPKIQRPLKGVPIKVGGYRSRTKKGVPPHRAYDMMVAEGTPVYPIGRGIVVAAEAQWWQKVNKGQPIRIEDRSWWDTVELEEKPISLKSGNFVIVYHPPVPKSRNPGYYSFYAHMADGVPVKPGQVVGPEDVIGYVEHSGYNAMRQGHGSHLHISVLKDLGKGYLEPIKFAKYLGFAEERPGRSRKSKATANRRKGRARRGV